MKKILVVGDIILDIYEQVTIERMAQEADVPIFDLSTPRKLDFRLGGAANVAANIRALSQDSELEVHIAGIHGVHVNPQLEELNILNKTTVFGEAIKKRRLVCDGKIVCRIDNGKKFSNDFIKSFEDDFLESEVRDYDIIVVSDYDKGTITEKIAQYVINSGVRTIIDSKRYDLSIFNGAFALNINKEEYSRQVSNKTYIPFEQLFDYALVTLGEDGSMLRQYENAEAGVATSYIIHSEEFPTREVEAVDVTGCGDTHTAAFAVGLARDSNDVRGAVRYANGCATIAVQKFGTTRVSKWDFSKSLEEE